MVLPGVVTVDDDSITVTDDAGQYLFLDLEGDVPGRSAVEFRFSGASYTPESFSGRLYRGDVSGEAYGETGGPLVFALPETGDGTDAGLAWSDGSWAPSAAVVERLEDPLPPFSVTLDGPETAAETSGEQLTVTVTNEGAGAGWYVLALNRIGPSVAYAPISRIAGELPAGERVTHSFEPMAPEDGRSTLYLLDVPGRQDGLSHSIEPADDA